MRMLPHGARRIPATFSSLGLVPDRQRPTVRLGFSYLSTTVGNADTKPSQLKTALESSSNGNRFILSVDDEAVILYSRQKVLESAGYNVLSAANGEQALGFFSAVTVDLVLLDYSMPGLDGGQVAKEMKAQRPLTPIILVTAYSIEKETLPYVDWFFTKGQDPGLLLEKIGQLLPLPPTA